MNQLYNDLAEQGLLGGILNNESSLDELTISRDDFYRDRHRIIFSAIERLRLNNAPIDIVSVTDELVKMGDLERVTASYLVGLADNNTGGLRSIQHYSSLVRDYSLKRQLKRVCEFGIESVVRGEGDFNALLNEIQGQIVNVGHHVKADYYEMADVARNVEGDIEHAIKYAGQVTGVPTGFKSLNKWTGGWQNADLIVIAARPSMGKTALLLNLIDNAAMEGAPVGVFSLEMSKEALAKRLLARRTHIPIQRMVNGLLKPEEVQRIVKANQQIKMLPIYIDDRVNVTEMDIMRAARKMIRDHHVKMIGVDYLQRVSPSRDSGKENENLALVCKGLKNVARNLEIPVVLLSQLNRDLEKRDDKRPILSDLKGSGDIEQEADLILFIYRDEYYRDNSPDKGIAEIDIAKFRNGETGFIKMAWSGVGQVFSDLAS